MTDRAHGEKRQMVEVNLRPGSLSLPKNISSAPDLSNESVKAMIGDSGSGTSDQARFSLVLLLGGSSGTGRSPAASLIRLTIPHHRKKF